MRGQKKALRGTTTWIMVLKKASSCMEKEQ
jgi:hypothetical protein